jgi:protein transport protein SEC23
LKTIENMPIVPYPPISCGACKATLNPFCKVDYNAKVWVCNLCYGRNQFPAHYSEISETHRPAELIPQ